MKESFKDVLRRSRNEGISDLNCIVFKLPFDLDFSHLIEFNRKINFILNFCTLKLKFRIIFS